MILTGFMGSGKTAVGREAARRLARPFFDTDHEVVQRAGKSISEIFASEGEGAFRKMEEEAVISLLDEVPPAGQVLSLGGGAVTLEAVRARLQNEPLVFFLESDLDEAFRRARGDSRPLARDPKAFARLYREREQIYRSVARKIINTTEKNVSEVAEELVAIVRREEEEKS